MRNMRHAHMYREDINMLEIDLDNSYAALQICEGLPTRVLIRSALCRASAHYAWDILSFNT